MLRILLLFSSFLSSVCSPITLLSTTPAPLVCNSTQYISPQRTCIPCSSSIQGCSQCTSSVACTVCSSGVVNNGYCCPPSTYYSTTLNRCIACPTNCLTCTSSSSCHICSTVNGVLTQFTQNHCTLPVLPPSVSTYEQYMQVTPALVSMMIMSDITVAQTPSWQLQFCSTVGLIINIAPSRCLFNKVTAGSVIATIQIKPDTPNDTLTSWAVATIIGEQVQTTTSSLIRAMAMFAPISVAYTPLVQTAIWCPDKKTYVYQYSSCSSPAAPASSFFGFFNMVIIISVVSGLACIVCTYTTYKHCKRVVTRRNSVSYLSNEAPQVAMLQRADPEPTNDFEQIVIEPQDTFFKPQSSNQYVDELKSRLKQITSEASLLPPPLVTAPSADSGETRRRFSRRVARRSSVSDIVEHHEEPIQISRRASISGIIPFMLVQEPIADELPPASHPHLPPSYHADPKKRAMTATYAPMVTETAPVIINKSRSRSLSVDKFSLSFANAPNYIKELRDSLPPPYTE